MALRTFLLCALCSLLPTAIIGVTVYARLAQATEEAAESQLQSLAKRYGVLLNERVKRAEVALLDTARRLLKSPDIPYVPLDEDQVVDIRAVPLAAGAPDGRRTVRDPEQSLQVLRSSLKVVAHNGFNTAQLQVVVKDAGGRALQLTGAVKPDYLWSSELMDATSVRFCVHSAGQQVSCVEDDARGDEGEQRRQQQWRLALRSQFDAADWQITASQSRSISDAGLTSILRTFPLLAGAALIIALLISSFEVRRAHRPLSELLGAFRVMARGRFTRVDMAGRNDEYGRIGSAFNKLSRTLRRQFRLLSTFERMDQLILARPDIDELVAAMLPRMPRMLGCHAVALLLRKPSREFTLTAVDREGGARWTADAPADTEAGCEALRAQWPQLEWEPITIRLHGQQRGLLLCGNHSGRKLSAELRRQAKGTARRVAVALRNEEREMLLVRQAYYDGLTDLPNRRLLRDRAQQALTDAAVTGARVALLYMDVDRFKNLNDSLGHRAGDELLRQLGQRMTRVIGAGNTVARLGGDEFAIVLRHVTPAEVSGIASGLLDELQQPLVLGGLSIVPQTSIGVAIFPDDGADIDVLLRNADAAMYRAKGLGGGRTVFFEDSMNRQAIRRLQLESGLRRALGEGGLRLVYQPKVQLSDGGWSGVEALLRWRDPALGDVPPSEFIPVAEESGMIHELGRHVLREAIAFCQRCAEAGAPIGHVAVNVSMLQLRDASLVEFIAGQCAERRLPPGMLQIEVTESAVMQDPGMVAAILARFRQMGIRVAIDDFGTGYSSLAVLQRLPVDILKIDRSFIQNVVGNTQALALLRLLLAVAGALELEVVAEGVETREQALLLAARGCHTAQGFFFSVPLEADAAAALAHQWVSPLPNAWPYRYAVGEGL